MESLGIEVKFLTGQIVNFLLLFGALTFFLYKPILKMLEDRRTKIADSLENAKKIEENLSKAEAKSREILDKTHAEARDIIQNAGEMAAEQKADLLAQTKLQSERILKTAEDEAKQMKDKIVKEARQEIAGVVALALDKIVGKELDETQKEKLAKKAIEEIGE